MKLNALKGIANNLICHLDSQIVFGYLKDYKFPVDTDIIEEKDKISKVSLAFFKERVPSEFDFKRVKSINLKANKTKDTVKIAVKIKVDDKEILASGGSIFN